MNAADGVFETEGTCGGVGSPERVVHFRLNSDLEALVVSTANPGTRAEHHLCTLSGLFIDAQQVELAGKSCRPKPQAKLCAFLSSEGDYFIFVDGVSGAGGIVELTVAEIALPQCANGMDDDGDGKTDYPEDPGSTAR